ncbi:putative Phosphate regulon transcriptional regulatory protein PhoB [Candidatus Hydrogenisulfobacillus filiaventi]|uniref:Stage 0 sporulation protein A homolog n=1 Tax=Candidatus Hydrogenisulfobacillus filiaventi TaxID=2707344 RepID=A0A6F8ZK08_9FIRM|nr:putative Phosphate regulon transcriptional regulatory protein PhoB [Candidatus Hydrogenisulfobacillus filiaventi]
MAAPPLLWVIDDDPGVVDLVAAYGAMTGWRVAGFGALGPAMARLGAGEQPAVVVLDWNLPDASDGIAALMALKARTDAPVVLLTVNDREADVIRALSEGADDYVVKPFSPGELMARLGAVYRRAAPAAAGERLGSADLLLDRSARQVWQGGRALALSTLEFDLLWTLAAHPGRVWTREELLDRIWGDAGEAFDRAVDTAVVRLRRKLGDHAEACRYIETVRGVGYRWCAGAGPPVSP